MSGGLVATVVWQPQRETFLLMLDDGRADEISEAEAWSFARALIGGLADLETARVLRAATDRLEQMEGAK